MYGIFTIIYLHSCIFTYRYFMFDNLSPLKSLTLKGWSLHPWAQTDPDMSACWVEFVVNDRHDHHTSSHHIDSGAAHPVQLAQHHDKIRSSDPRDRDRWLVTTLGRFSRTSGPTTWVWSELKCVPELELDICRCNDDDGDGDGVGDDDDDGDDVPIENGGFWNDQISWRVSIESFSGSHLWQSFCIWIWLRQLR